MFIRSNLPDWERALRLCLGVLTTCVIVHVLPVGTLRLCIYAAAISVVGTAVLGFCPLCALLRRKPQKPNPCPFFHS